MRYDLIIYNYFYVFGQLFVLYKFLLMSKKQNKQVHQYITNKINVFIEPLVYDLVIAKPSNPVEFAIEWLNKFNSKNTSKSIAHIESDSEGEQLDQVKDLQTKIIQKKAKRFHNKSRIGISEEVFGIFNLRQDINLKEKHSLTENQSIMVRSLIRNSILFQNLDNKDEEAILRAISSQVTTEFELIIKQGQAADVLYIVESGEYDCYKLIGDQNVYIKTYYTGETFGELSLMYNAPRAASIVTKIPGKLLTLDRSIFSHVLKVASLRKKTIIKNAIQKIEVLRAIPESDRSQLINILKEEKYREGQYIIKQGEEGNKFYIVLEGTLVAEKQEGNQLPKIVFKYEQGDYFGQLALINNEARQASIRSMTAVKLAYISSQGFKRVFGPIKQALKQQSHKYH